MNPISHASDRGRFAKRAIAIVSLTALLGACADMSDTQRRTGTGAAIGAATGAVIGSTTGGKAGTGALIGGAIGAIAGNVWSRHMESQQRAMEQATQGTGVEVTRTNDNQLKLNVPADVSFDVGRADIKPELRSVLEQFASGLKSQPNTLVNIVGHTDSTGSDAVNDPLSRERAQSVKGFLVDRGVSSGRVDTAGRGAREPVADNGSADGRARNRRVEIFLREPASGAG
ncbi:MAG: OmpA family protein [Rubrivivax sp.]|nr:MAG: OmpA family protein [Rubrivivax sp.]